MAFICNTFTVRIVEVILSLAFMSVGAFVLRSAVQGKIKHIRIIGIRAKDTSLVCGIIAALLLLLGILVLISAVLHLDC
jgi:hypothetical protein